MDVKKVSNRLMKTPKQKQIMEFIIKQKEVSYPVFKENFPKQSQFIKKLEEKYLIEIKERELFRESPVDVWEEVKSIQYLTPEQEKALKEIKEGISKEKFAPYLLHGVTGSGKTEIYIHLIDEIIKSGKQKFI